MRMLIKLMVMAITLNFGNQLVAQGPGEGHGPDENMTAEERATKRTEKMKTELSLNADQEKQVYEINLAHLIQMDKYREEQKALREKVKAEKEATRTKIKAVLTPEQNVIFDQKAEEHKKKQEACHKHQEH
ncbi:MAG: DUF4890 domain-containing protein [Bacteroidetes bacterium]|nr:DUF4890 domain-containing protein [Bacteroidota bacterium]